MSRSAVHSMRRSGHAHTRVSVLSNGDCVKARRIAESLRGLGVEPELYDVDRDERAQTRFGHLFADGEVKAPSLIIREKRFRNPDISDLEKLVIRHGVVERRMLHQPQQGRFVWPMMPSDAFASYVVRDNRRIVGHIEVDSSLRGSGFGRELANELLQELCHDNQETFLTCGFLRKVASENPHWAKCFL